MFSVEPIHRQTYRFVMLVVVGLLIVVIAGIEKFASVLLLLVDCQQWPGQCGFFKTSLPSYVSVITVVISMVAMAVATIRRIATTPISNYWVVFLTVLVYLDHQYLIGFDTLWSGDLEVALYNAPWFLLTASAIVFLLSFAPARSTYFKQGFAGADPPLGWFLSISSFWLLAVSGVRIVEIISQATGITSLGVTAFHVQQQIDKVIPALITLPIIPAIVFSFCALLMAILGWRQNDEIEETVRAPIERMQTAVQTTRAARRLKGYNF